MATKLGFPAIPLPNSLDLRPLQAAVSNTRQRIEQLERLFGVFETSLQQASQSGSTGVQTLAQQIAALTARIVALENAAATDIGTYIAGEAIAIGTGVVPFSPTTVIEADPSDPTRMFSLIGIALNDAATGQAVQVQRRGVLAIPGVTGLSVGRAIYATFGGITQFPSYAATALPMGVAVSSTQIFISPDWPALQGPVFASAVGDAYIRFLPVTFSMVERIVEVMNGLFDEAPGFVYWNGEELITDPTPPDTNFLVTNAGDALVTNSGDNLVWS